METLDASVTTSRMAWLATGLAVGCALVAAAVQAWAALWTVLALIGAGGWISLRHPRIRSVNLEADDRIRITRRNGDEFTGSMAGSAFVSPAYIGFRIRRRDGRTRVVGLFRDAMQSADFRRLAALLRYPEAPERA